MAIIPWEKGAVTQNFNWVLVPSLIEPTLIHNETNCLISDASLNLIRKSHYNDAISRSQRSLTPWEFRPPELSLGIREWWNYYSRDGLEWFGR
ncbi:hypothetical protein CEXT_9601 [Caerostris extrusa]|uniref:Uncharacterized protein n=1 Tax=Caerostris extrusa TaxID=172846 RepID=A0AAV4YEM6_CAEEX|nr:hypothetical protein CEXT_9601 [Caerostris extrusa]